MKDNLKIANKLRSSGLRPTKQRIQIAEFLFEREKTFHFTVEDLDRIINSKINEEKISLATFYNTVHAFKKSGHLKEILTSNNKSYFDTHTGSHHHFFDSKTKELTDIDSKEIKIKNIPNAPKGKSIKDIDVVINIENDSQ
jgi:Fur family iron response transcriptional regulator|tara:strand:- start:21 stop:443 length:423 start_codon:yes stop_codon:yes gene_type:complete